MYLENASLEGDCLTNELLAHGILVSHFSAPCSGFTHPFTELDWEAGSCSCIRFLFSLSNGWIVHRLYTLFRLQIWVAWHEAQQCSERNNLLKGKLVYMCFETTAKLITTCIDFLTIFRIFRLVLSIWRMSQWKLFKRERVGNDVQYKNR